MTLRWSEEYLQTHLKIHRSRAKTSQERTKQQNQAKVQKAKKNAVDAKSVRNTDYEEELVLSCEIATTPPSVNHYWERCGKGMRLSDKARDFSCRCYCPDPSITADNTIKTGSDFSFSYSPEAGHR